MHGPGKRSFVAEPLAMFRFLSAVAASVLRVSEPSRFRKAFEVVPSATHASFSPMLAATAGITPASSPLRADPGTVGGAAWAIPIVATGGSAPSFARSGEPESAEASRLGRTALYPLSAGIGARAHHRTMASTGLFAAAVGCVPGIHGAFACAAPPGRVGG